MLLEREWLGYVWHRDRIRIDEKRLPYLTAHTVPLRDTAFLLKAGELELGEVQGVARQLALNAKALRAELGW